jgi:hypothetical protein
MWKLARIGGLIGASVGALIGAVGGLTGAMEMEYKTVPLAHAIMLAWTFGVYGGIAGTGSGLLAWLIRIWVTRLKHDGNPPWVC